MELLKEIDTKAAMLYSNFILLQFTSPNYNETYFDMFWIEMYGNN